MVSTKSTRSGSRLGGDTEHLADLVRNTDAPASRERPGAADREVPATVPTLEVPHRDTGGADRGRRPGANPGGRVDVADGPARTLRADPHSQEFERPRTRTTLSEPKAAGIHEERPPPRHKPRS